VSNLELRHGTEVVRERREAFGFGKLLRQIYRERGCGKENGKNVLQIATGVDTAGFGE